MVAGIDDAQDCLDLVKDSSLKYCDSSAIAKCSFCSEFGESLFYQLHNVSVIDIASSIVDQSDQFAATKHIIW